ncbi:cupin domain-containing protein [Chitinophaga lutea]
MKDKTSPIFQEGALLPLEPADPGVTRQVFGHDARLMLVKVIFETGAVGSMHSHPHSQASYVESGVFELTIGPDKKVLRKGDGYYVPPQVVHGCVCLEAGVLIDAFSPAREDFL